MTQNIPQIRKLFVGEKDFRTEPFEKDNDADLRSGFYSESLSDNPILLTAAQPQAATTEIFLRQTLVHLRISTPFQAAADDLESLVVRGEGVHSPITGLQDCLHAVKAEAHVWCFTG